MKDGIEIAQVAWSIDPGTVYGFLVAFMLVIIVTMGFVIRYMYTKMERFYTRLLTAFAENTSAFESLQSTIDDYNDPDKRTIRNMQLTNYMDKKFNELKNQQK